MTPTWSNPNPAANETESPAETYVYPPARAPGSAAKPVSPPRHATTLESLWGGEAKAPILRPDSEEQIRACEAAAREAGRKEGEAQAREEYGNKLTAEHEELTQALREFAHERETYFSRVEAEVVGLALGIARKILHREAQVDPLLLAGVVRIGLEKVAAGTHVRLRVHPDQIPAWQEFFTQLPDLQSVPELMGDAALDPGHCRLETELGSTDLTLETQLKEIEQGFFDLLAQRPQKHA
jgi:flagellar assembly protein FliH